MPISGSYFYSGARIASSLPNKIAITDGVHDAEVDAGGHFVAISQPHHQIHAGVMYGVTEDYTNLASGNSRLWMVRTPISGANGSSLMHFRYAVDTTGLSKIELWEGATTAASGSALSSYNIKRYLSNDVSASWTAGPTVTNSGTLLEVHHVGSTGIFGTRGAGAGQNFEEELILKSNIQYLIKVTSTDGSAINVGLNVRYYLQGN